MRSVCGVELEQVLNMFRRSILSSTVNVDTTSYVASGLPDTPTEDSSGLL